ncbi:MAG: UvrD-helicase domain-containing protein [Thermoguttaceae bacterium]|nr:UvrD-helicase domain-containing protein [Thermoguttaceae bacterium]
MENVLIQASAGTGKTHQLACRYLLLLFSGVRPENILATTFTKKAAGEILNRILSWLAEAALDEDKCRKLSKNLSAAKAQTMAYDTAPVELTLDDVRAKLYDVIKCLNRVNVSTLDSYFNQRVQCFSLELHLPMDWSIMDESVDKKYRQTVLSNMFRDEDIVRRYVSLILKGNELKRSVFGEMSLIVNNLYTLWKEAPSGAWDVLQVPEALEEKAFQKLLSKTLRLLKNAHLPNSPEKDVEALGNRDTRYSKAVDFLSKSLAKNTWKYNKSVDQGISYSRKLITDPETIDCLVRLVNYAQAFVKFVKKEQSDFYRDTLGVFDELYMDYKKDMGQLIFDDIPWLLIRNIGNKFQLNDSLGMDSDSFRMDSTIQHLMLDEFQDTSLAQWRVLEPLAKKTAQDENGSFFCVGDAKQAIYGWRGGEAQLLQDMPRLLDPAHIHTTQMIESRRSGMAIMQAVNDVFSILGYDKEKQNRLICKKDGEQTLQASAMEWRRRFEDHVSHESCNKPSYVELRTVPYEEDATEEDKDDKDQLRLMVYRYTAQRIKELYDQTAKRKLDFSIGVLVRSNEVGANVADCIKKLGLECSLEGKSPLLDSYEACLIMALMKWIDHPDDAYSYYQVCNSPLGRKLELKDFQKKVVDAAQRLEVAVDDRRILNQLRYELFCNGYGLTVQRWADLLKPDADARSRRRLETLVELTNKYDSQGSTRTDDYIEYINGASVFDAFNTRIRVMTYHQSKGLEFDIVVLPQLDSPLVNYDTLPVVSGRPTPIENPDEIIRSFSSDIRYLLPDDQQQLFSVDEKKQMQEALCNLYVAMTRAKQGLYMFLRPPKMGKQSYNKTYEDVLLGSLTDLSSKNDKKPDTVYYSVGDPNWIQNTKKKDDDSKDESEHIVVGEFQFKKASRSFCVPLPATAWTTKDKPSSFVDVISAQVDNVKSSASSLSQNVRGTLFHCWLADIEWLEEYRGDDQRLTELGIGIGLQQDSFIELLPTFKALLKNPNVIAALQRPDSSWETYREKSVAGILKDSDGTSCLVSGIIDRLTLHRSAGRVDKAFVLDYKTVGKESSLSDVRSRYAGQMDAYRQIVAQMYKISVKDVKTTLLILEGDF